jgi:hypothetical protein
MMNEDANVRSDALISCILGNTALRPMSAHRSQCPGAQGRNLQDLQEFCANRLGGAKGRGNSALKLASHMRTGMRAPKSAVRGSSC